MYRREVYSNLGHYGKLIAADKSKACIQRDAVKTWWSFFFITPHNWHRIVSLRGRCMDVFCEFDLCLISASATVVLYEMSSYAAPRHNSTRFS